MTLLDRGVIYDGCPIVAKGTIRINNGEISIDTMHNLMAVDGKNFAALCEPDGGKNEQGDIKDSNECMSHSFYICFNVIYNLYSARSMEDKSRGTHHSK